MYSQKVSRRKALLLSSAACLSPLLVSCGGSSYEDITIPLPAVLRNDLHYVYYLSVPGQTKAVQDHTSLIWHAQFYNNDMLELETKDNTFGIILDCALQLFDKNAAVSSTAQLDLHNYFSDLEQRGLLSRVQYLIPMDEPNLFARSEQDLRDAVTILKAEAKLWTSLNNVKYMCVYGGKGGNLTAIEEFDIVGIDNYEQKSEILTKGAHAALMRAITPNQQVLILPGAAFGQDPAAFIAYAHSTPQAWGVVPFIWAHIPASADKEGWTGFVNRSIDDQNQYRNAGLLTLNKL